MKVTLKTIQEAVDYAKSHGAAISKRGDDFIHVIAETWQQHAALFYGTENSVYKLSGPERSALIVIVVKN